MADRGPIYVSAEEKRREELEVERLHSEVARFEEEIGRIRRELREAERKSGPAAIDEAKRRVEEARTAWALAEAHVKEVERSYAVLSGWRKALAYLTYHMPIVGRVPSAKSARDRALRTLTRLERELPEAERLSREWARRVEELSDELADIVGRLDATELRLATEEDRLKRKIVIPVVGLQRVAINAYIIIEGGEKTYEYYREKHGYRRSVPRKYPKGSFQSIFELDAFVDPDTAEIITNEEPYPTLERLIKRYAVREFLGEFGVSYSSEDITIGEASTVPDKADIGKPPLKVRVERTVDPEERGVPWEAEIGEYLMMAEEYLTLVGNFKKYLDALRGLR